MSVASFLVQADSVCPVAFWIPRARHFGLAAEHASTAVGHGVWIGLVGCARSIHFRPKAWACPASPCLLPHVAERTPGFHNDGRGRSVRWHSGCFPISTDWHAGTSSRPFRGFAVHAATRVEFFLGGRQYLTVYKTLEALLDGQKRVLTLINEDRPLPEILDTICRVVDAQAEGMYSSILLLDEEGQHLLHGAAPHLPEAYCKAIHGISIGEGVGSCGTAAARGTQVIVENIAAHPFWAPFKKLAYDTHGLAACWSSPIRAYDGKVVATFAIYHKTPKAPTLAEYKLIDFTSHLVAIAVNRAREMASLKTP